jgi:hypothetical protein
LQGAIGHSPHYPHFAAAEYHFYASPCQQPTHIPCGFAVYIGITIRGAAKDYDLIHINVITAQR